MMFQFQSGKGHEDQEVQFRLTVHSPATSSFIPPITTPGSLYEPSDVSLSFTEVDGDKTAVVKPRDHLNAFLAACDISLIRYSLATPWDEASARTKRPHTRRARQVIDACLEEIAPQEKHNLLRTVCESQNTNENIDPMLLEALVECCSNADHWGTRRQILSITADKVSLKTFKCGYQISPDTGTTTQGSPFATWTRDSCHNNPINKNLCCS